MPLYPCRRKAVKSLVMLAEVNPLLRLIQVLKFPLSSCLLQGCLSADEKETQKTKKLNYVLIFELSERL